MYLAAFLTYHSPTSYSAIFREDRLDHTQDDFPRQTTNERCNLEAQEHIDQGTRVLQRWPDRTLCERLIRQYFEIAEVMIPEKIVYYCHESIWSTYGSALVQPRRQDQLSAMSRELCRTAMSLIPPASNTQEWMKSFSGHRLRWEIIGNFNAIFGFSTMTIAEWDPLFTTARSSGPYHKREYGGQMRECAEACLALCNDVDAINDFVVCLTSSAYALQSFHEGDASGSTYSASMPPL